MTFTTAITIGLGFFTGVLIGWALVFTALFITYSLVKFFSQPEAPEHAVDENVPDDDFWKRIQDEPAYLRRQNKDSEQLELPL